MHKLLIINIISLVFNISAYTQKTIDATEIINMINDGQDINIKNAVIEGALNLTRLNNMELEENNSSQKQYICTVEVLLHFENCTFNDDVVAHECTENSNECYKANFNNSISFISCVFNKESNFKHSDFNGELYFTGSKFNNEANFKHADIKEPAYFENCIFEEAGDFKHTDFSDRIYFTGSSFKGYGDFKHTDFHKMVGFKNVTFNEYADFKHTDFKQGADFENCRFTKYADFKHVDIKNPVNIEKAIFEGNVSIEHANIGDMKFVNYLLQSKNKDCD